MNSMYVNFAGGQIFKTDYFLSRDREEGRAWLALEGGIWHVLLPRLCQPLPTVAYARPVTDCQEPDRWRWRLELDEWHLPLPCRQIIGPRPFLPQPYTCSERPLTLYASEMTRGSGQTFFGSIQHGIQIHGVCRLYLVRETRHGEKAKDRQRSRTPYR